MSLMNHRAGELCLVDVKSVLDMAQVPYFLMQGTALGAWRDHGFVPTERDIDIGILQEHLQPQANLILEGFQCLGFDVECFQMPFTRPRTIVGFKAYGMHVAKVDIVGLVHWKDKRFTATPVRGYIDRPYALVHPAEELEHYRTVTLFGNRYNVPANIEEYLEREYGPTWQKPQDDHTSRTRVYNFIEQEGIPRDYLEQYG